jgi:hypothetical protein
MARRLLFLIGLSLALLRMLAPLLAADGGKAKNVVYETRVPAQTGTGSMQFTIDTSPIIFYLTTVNTKYHVLLVRVKNDTAAPLVLEGSGHRRVHVRERPEGAGPSEHPGGGPRHVGRPRTEIRRRSRIRIWFRPARRKGSTYVRVADVKAPALGTKCRWRSHLQHQKRAAPDGDPSACSSGGLKGTDHDQATVVFSSPVARLRLLLAPALDADGARPRTSSTRRARSPDRDRQPPVLHRHEPIIFYLTTVNTKYDVLLLRVKNDTAAPLVLSKDQDAIELVFADGQKVQGLLNVPSVDRATWDGLETEIRTAVSYPDLVQAREEEGIYVYIPIGDVKAPRLRHEMPMALTYRIKSLPRPIRVGQRSVAKA